jgi:predicted transposase/invertase (TIGR01784 family)
MKTNIHSPHDKYFRRSMSYPQVAENFFAAHLPEKIKNIADFKTLQLRKESYLDQELKESLTDILFSVNMTQEKGYFYILVEHQSSVDKLMPFRLFKYMLLIMEQHLRENKEKKLPLIYPLVFYTGPRKYDASTDFFDLFVESKTLAQEIFLKPFQLIDVNQALDDKSKTQLWSSVMELCLKHTYERDILPIFHQNMIYLLRSLLPEKEGKNFIEDTITYLVSTAEISDLRRFIKLIQENLTLELGEKTMTLLEQATQKGYQKGRQEGHHEGHQKGHQKGHQEGVTMALQYLLKNKLIQQADLDVAQLTDNIVSIKDLS